MPADSQHALEEIRRRIRSGGSPALFLDFDGTLAPIQNNPDDVHISSDVAATLARCASRFPLCILTGRALSDIRRRVNVPRATYAGNHGMEWWDGVREGVTPLSKEALADIEATRAALARLGDRSGVLVEDKRISIAFHYRNVPADEVEDILAETRHLLAPIIGRGHIEVLPQKMVLDIRPKGWHKGDFISLQLSQMPPAAFAIFIGDDATDEDAFRSLQDGVTIRVGGRDGSAARFALPATSDVQAFLENLLELD